MSHARKRKSARRGRSLRMESLERRNLLAGDGFHNFLDPADVNNDDAVTALDALTIVNRLNRSEASGEEVGSLSDRYWDVNDDGHASAVDALMVINQLSRDSAGAGGELEAKLSGDASERVKVKFEHAGQGRKLEVKIQNALPSSTFDVSVEGESLGSVATDANGRGRIELREFDSVGRPLPSIVAGNAVTISEIGTSVFGGKGESDDHDGSHDVSGVGDSDHGINDVDGNGVGDSNDGLNDVDGSGVNGSDDVYGVGDSSHGINDVDDHGVGDSDDGVNDVDHVPPTAPVVSGSQYGEWRAILSGVGSGNAEFGRESRESEFEVEVRGAG